MGPLARFLSLFLAAAVSVSAVPVDPSVVVTKTVLGRAVTVTSQDLENFQFFAQYAGAAYCNNDAAPGALLTCSNNVCPLATANRATVVHSLDSNTPSNIDGFIGLDDARKLIVLSLRGSTSVRNWISNLLFIMVPCKYAKNCGVHTGFNEAWNDIKEDVLAVVAKTKAANPTYSVVATGHSLGGAVATLAAVELRLAGIPTDLYTFGSPRVGNLQLVEFASNQAGAEYRLTHVEDPVPRLPPMFLGYRHTTPEYWLSTGTSKTTDYALSDIKVCEGYANTDCNGSTLGLDGDSHVYYLLQINGCGSSTFSFKRDTDSAAVVSDEELVQRLNTWAEMDRQYAASLLSESGTTFA